MNLRLLIPIVALLALSGPVYSQENWSPAYPVLNRYRADWQNSPFTRTTKSASGADFAKDLVLSGISGINDSWTVLVVNRKTREYQSLTQDSNADGLRVVRVFPDGVRRKVKVIVSNGKEEATLSYDPNFKLAPGEGSVKSPTQTETSEKGEQTKLPLRLPGSEE